MKQLKKVLVLILCLFSLTTVKAATKNYSLNYDKVLTNTYPIYQKTNNIINKLNNNTQLAYNINENNKNVGQIKVVTCGGNSNNKIPANVPTFIRTLFNILKVLVPVILIGLGMYDFFSAVIAKKESDMDEKKSKFMRRIVAAVLVFFIMSIVQWIFGMFNNSNNFLGCLACFLSKEEACIDAGYENPGRLDEENQNNTPSKTPDGTGGNNVVVDNSDKSNSGSAIIDSGSNSTTGNNGDLEKQINDYLKENGATGDWAIYVKNLKNNSTVAINADKQMVAASEIKLFIMAATYDKINAGKISESSVKEDVRQMIKASSNEATNRLIDGSPLTFTEVNNYMSNNGYSKSLLQRKMLDTSTNKENYTSANDLGNILEKIYNGNLIGATYSKTMLGFLKEQERRNKIPAGVPSDVTTANKTGELDNVENDAAIVYSNGGDYIIVVLSQNLSNTAKAIENITKISGIVYNYYN